ncbi:NADP-dependent D-sorbitol-6-phosphate dehydrogenase [Camellia lanceoleosa]|nr:NADP-dependent D-sorbitol-6-phosphate dehydrogenase [Camellia lanceoleosa]
MSLHHQAWQTWQPILFNALKLGYRHFDCAADYKNEPEVGEALAEAFQTRLVKREDLFITTKLWNSDHGHVEAWHAMESLVSMGLVRSIGISNCDIFLTRDCLAYSKVKPAVNQIETHPYFQRDSLPATSGGNITYEGRFDILSLSGSYIRTELGGRTGGLSVCLSSTDGHIIGGGIGGPLKAAGPVQVIVGTFLIDTKKDIIADAKGVGASGSGVGFQSAVDSSGRVPRGVKIIKVPKLLNAVDHVILRNGNGLKC